MTINLNEVVFKEVETKAELIDAIRLRVDVFITEQGFLPGWEPDEEDKEAHNFVGLLSGQVVATGRWRYHSGNEVKIERMATAKPMRNQGVASALLRSMLVDICAKGVRPERIWLTSQVTSQPFYERCNFKVVSEVYDLWGVAHVEMDYPSQELTNVQ